MRDNKNDWMDSLGSDDLRERLLKKPALPVREVPKQRKRSKMRFHRPLPTKLKNPVNFEKVEKAKEKGSKVEVSVNLTLPRVRAKKILNQYKNNTFAKVMSVILVVILVNVLVVSVVKHRGSSNQIKGSTTSSKGAKTPSFKPVLPGGDAVNTVSKQISYDPDKKVVSYSDKIGDINITVSQQPLPQDFKDNPDARVELFAKNSNFNDLIQIKDGRAHVGTSSKGPQSVIFHKNGLLIFLRSDKKILNADWVKYINSLRQD